MFVYIDGERERENETQKALLLCKSFLALQATVYEPTKRLLLR